MKTRRTGLSLVKKSYHVWYILIAIGAIAALVAIVLHYYPRETANDRLAIESSQEPVQKQEVATNREADTNEEKAIPATQPTSLTIAAADVQSAPIIPVGINVSGEMAAPGSNHEVGWYDQSAEPIQDGGALLLDGHVGLSDQPAVFKNLHRLKPGDVIETKTQDNSVYQYTVYHVEQLPLEKVDMRKMMRSVDPSKQGLNIITCAGEYDPTRSTYDDRVLVYAVRNP